jgi:hypothetical protein
MVWTAAHMMCKNTYDLGKVYAATKTEGHEMCVAKAEADHVHCAFNPTVINYQEGGDQHWWQSIGRECRCAVPEATACRVKEASAMFTISVSAGNVAQSALVGVVGDPFTQDKYGKAVQFFLPKDRDTRLLACDNMQLHGHAMSTGLTGDYQQWFDRFVVQMDGQEVLKVEINKDASKVVESHTTHKPLTTMAVAVEGSKVHDSDVVLAHNGFMVEVTQDRTQRVGQNGFSEIARFTAGGTVMDFASATASKFSSETMQQLHRHLDVRFASLNTTACTTGMLAEIWGVAPMSKETTAMLQMPDGR